MGTEALNVKTHSNIISFEYERKKRLSKLLNKEAKTIGRLTVRSYDQTWNPIRDFQLNAAGAALFWRLFASGYGGIHTAHVTVYELHALVDAGILVIEGGERLALGGDVAGYEVIEGKIPTRVLKRGKRCERRAKRALFHSFLRPAGVA